MPLKVNVSLHCAVCEKRVPLRGKTYTRHSRRYGSSSGILLPDVYVVDAPEKYDEFNSMQISRGFKFTGGGDIPEDKEGLVCSLPCAVKLVTKLMARLKSEVVEED